jgi:16S rRNA (guanine966-N2)-methyltransferase
MRITGGTLRGRKLRTLNSLTTRPTQDRVREALFSMLGETTRDARFLDLCAGSGAVGIEAWSRGAAYVCWVEQHRRAAEVLRRNVEELCPGVGDVVGCDAVLALKKHLVKAPFDIIFCDPPYGDKSGRVTAREGVGFLRAALELALRERVLAEGGVFVAELRAESEPLECPGWHLVRDRVYGESALRILCPV